MNGMSYDIPLDKQRCRKGNRADYTRQAIRLSTRKYYFCHYWLVQNLALRSFLLCN